MRQASHALDALLQGLGSVAEAASKELGKKATEEEIAKRAVKLSLGERFETPASAKQIVQVRVASRK